MTSVFVRVPEIESALAEEDELAYVFAAKPEYKSAFAELLMSDVFKKSLVRSVRTLYPQYTWVVGQSRERVDLIADDGDFVTRSISLVATPDPILSVFFVDSNVDEDEAMAIRDLVASFV